MASGRVPPTVATFSELHDYVDANCYGQSEEMLEELSEGTEPTDDDSRRTPLDALCDLMNPAMDIINQWLAVRRSAVAAGPELLDACRTLMASTRDLKNGVELPPSMVRALGRMVLAIAKADPDEFIIPAK